jgi:hypothetical protein
MLRRISFNYLSDQRVELLMIMRCQKHQVERYFAVGPGNSGLFVVGSTGLLVWRRRSVSKSSCFWGTFSHSMLLRQCLKLREALVPHHVSNYAEHGGCSSFNSKYWERWTDHEVKMRLKSEILRRTWYRFYVFLSRLKNYQNSQKLEGPHLGHVISTDLMLIKTFHYAPRGFRLWGTIWCHGC